MRQQCVMNIHQSIEFLQEEILKLKREIELLKEKINKDSENQLSKII